jgi:hypothetical protein
MAAAPAPAPAPPLEVDDLEDLGGALSSDGVRVTRDLPPVVRVRARGGAMRGAGARVSVDATATTSGDGTAGTTTSTESAAAGSRAADLAAASAAKGENVPGSATVGLALSLLGLAPHVIFGKCQNAKCNIPVRSA